MRRSYLATGLFVALSLFLTAMPSLADEPSIGLVRIGIIGIGSEKEVSRGITAFQAQLSAFGYVRGANLEIDARWANGDPGRLPDLVGELVRRKVDILVATTTYDVRVAKTKTSTIPIVMVTAADPVATGLVTSLARPEGNVTGLSLMTIELSTKRLQLLKDAFPNIARVAVLWNPDHPFHGKVVAGIKTAAPRLSLEPVFVSARAPAQLATALQAAKRARAQALCVIEDPFFYLHRAAITQLAAKERLPAIFGAREYSEAGGLLSYGPNYADMWHRVAGYVDKILKGAKPRDLPIEQPTKFELVVNLKTAKSLGVRIPESVLVQATEVIK